MHLTKSSKSTPPEIIASLGTTNGLEEIETTATGKRKRVTYRIYFSIWESIFSITVSLEPDISNRQIRYKNIRDLTIFLQSIYCQAPKTVYQTLKYIIKDNHLTT
jgi:hypothetical protein